MYKIALTKIGPSQYRHETGAIIELRGKRGSGKDFQLRGWAIIRAGREVSRWSHLEMAAKEAWNR